MNPTKIYDQIVKQEYCQNYRNCYVNDMGLLLNKVF